MPTVRVAVVIAILRWQGLRAQNTRDQGRLGDLDYVATQVPRLHVNFFADLDPADFNNAVQALQAEIPDLTDAEFYVRLAQLIAMAGDEHTYLYLDGAAATKAGFAQFPLQFRWLDDGVFVTGAAPEYSKTIGTQLVPRGSTLSCPLRRALVWLSFRFMPEDSSVNEASNPAAAGSVVQFQMTGYNPAVRVFIGGLPVPLADSGPLLELPGRWQIKVRITDAMTGQVPLYAIGGSVASNGVTLWVR